MEFMGLPATQQFGTFNAGFARDNKMKLRPT
jgi:hypothetical protein